MKNNAYNNSLLCLSLYIFSGFSYFLQVFLEICLVIFWVVFLGVAEVEVLLVEVLLVLEEWEEVEEVIVREKEKTIFIHSSKNHHVTISRHHIYMYIYIYILHAKDAYSSEKK